jgi:hypothetical protein
MVEDDLSETSGGAQPGGVILPKKQRYKVKTNIVDDNPGNIGQLYFRSELFKYTLTSKRNANFLKIKDTYTNAIYL